MMIASNNVDLSSYDGSNMASGIISHGSSIIPDIVPLAPIVSLQQFQKVLEVARNTDGYSCVLPRGEFGNKVCINNKKIGGCGLKKDIRSYNFKSNGLTNDESNDDSNIGFGDGSSAGVKCLADIDVDNKSKNDFCEINIFKKNYWRNIFSFCDDFKHIKDPKLRRKLQLKDICRNKKINLNV